MKIRVNDRTICGGRGSLCHVNNLLKACATADAKSGPVIGCSEESSTVDTSVHPRKMKGKFVRIFLSKLNAGGFFVVDQEDLCITSGVNYCTPIALFSKD